MFLFLLSCSYSDLSETISKSYFVSILSNALQLRFTKMVSKKTTNCFFMTCTKKLSIDQFHTYYAIRNTQKCLTLNFLFPVNQLQIQIRNNRNTRNIIFTIYRYAGLLKHKNFCLLAADIFAGKNVLPIYLG